MFDRMTESKDRWAEADRALPPTTEPSMLTLRVQAVTREAEGILAYELVDPEGGALPPFSAGAHVEVEAPGGLRRQYSLCNDPDERHRYVIAVLKEAVGRGGSKAMHEAVGAGSLLNASAPMNRFELAGSEARYHLLLAGGIGITPLMAMIETLESRGVRWKLHYCTRSPETTAFRARLEPRIAAGRVALHHDGGDPSRGLDLQALLAEYEIGTHVYFCGPPGFMSAAKASTAAWPPHCVHFEYFTGAENDPGLEDAPFRIELKRSGRVLEVPADRSIVDVLRDAGHDIETDCEDGYCGTCITRYLEGEPEHRDTVLSENERGSYVMICCARAKGPPLVLDL